MSDEPRIIDLKPWSGSVRVAWGLVAGNAAIVAAAVLAHTGVSAVGGSEPIRIGATLLAGSLVALALVAAHRRRLRSTAARLVLTRTSMQIFPRRGPTREVPLSTLQVRRLAYLVHQGSHPDHPHMMVLDLRIHPFGRLRICGRGIRGGWPAHEGEARIPPELEVTADDWATLCECLEAAGALPATGAPNP